MADEDKTREQLIEELLALRLRVAALGQSETDLRHVQETLDKQLNFFQILMDTIPNPIFFKSVEGLYLGCNKAFEAFLGLRRSEIVGKSVYDLAPKELADQYWKADSELFARPGVQVYESSVQPTAGERRDVVFHKATFPGLDGTLAGLVGVILDITDRKQAERALRESEQRFRAILDSVGEAIFIHDLNTGEILDVNRKTCEMYGYGREEIKRCRVEDLSLGEPPYTQEYALARLKKAAEGEPQVFEWRAKTRSGRLFWIEISIRRAVIGNRELLLVTGRDITERKAAEDALRESERSYRELFNTVPDAILLSDAETGQFVDTNESSLQLYDYTRDELLSLKYEDISAEPERSAASIKETLAGKRLMVPLRYHRKRDGTVFPVEISTSSFIVAGRWVLCGVIRDVTERRLVEEELHNYRRHLEYLVAERTKELGKANTRLTREIEERKRAEASLQEASKQLKFFAYSVAHDLKSPAIGIYGLTRRLSKQAKDLLDDKSRNYCDQILRASEHIAALVEKINVYIATKEARLSIERINVKEIFQMLREEFSAQLSIRNIEWAEPEEALEIRADRLSVLRVFRNLLDNSLKYGGEQLSKIRIGYENLEEFHVLSVCDNGKGLREEDAERIFQPFERNETSRGVEGTGLGLTIVKEIAEQHGGKVWAKPLTKKGAAFFISISKDL
jgi:PAS domain S-box-containing protein